MQTQLDRHLRASRLRQRVQRRPFDGQLTQREAWQKQIRERPLRLPRATKAHHRNAVRRGGIERFCLRSRRQRSEKAIAPERCAAGPFIDAQQLAWGDLEHFRPACAVGGVDAEGIGRSGTQYARAEIGRRTDVLTQLGLEPGALQQLLQQRRLVAHAADSGSQRAARTENQLRAVAPPTARRGHGAHPIAHRPAASPACTSRSAW